MERDVLGERHEEEEEHRECEPDQAVLHRVDGEAPHQLEQEERGEGEADEEETVLRRALELLVEAGGLEERHRELLAALRREARHAPGGAEARGADLVALGEEAAEERRMGPRRAHRHRGVRAEGHQRKRFRSGEFQGEREVRRPGLQVGKQRVQPARTRRIAGARSEGGGAPRHGHRPGRADAVRVADAEHEPRRAPLVAAGAVFLRRGRRDGKRAARLQLRRVQARLVQAARLLAHVGDDRPLHGGGRHAQHLRLLALDAGLALAAVHGLALHLGPVALVGQREIGPGERLALAPAFRDAFDRLGGAALALRDQVADQVDRDQQHERERAHGERLQQEGVFHPATVARQSGAKGARR
jgi:hypothetical protein